MQECRSSIPGYPCITSHPYDCKCFVTSLDFTIDHPGGRADGGEESSDPDDITDASGEWDDVDDDLYEQRVNAWEAGNALDPDDDIVFDGGYRIPGTIYSRLFDYQKTGTYMHQSNGTA